MAPTTPAGGAPIGPLPFESPQTLTVHHPQRVLDLAPAPLQEFASFVVGDNAELVALLRDARPPAASERFIYLWGAGGSGRTHLLHAAVAVAGAAARYMDLAAPDGPIGVELLAGADGAARSRIALDNVDAIDSGAQQRLFNFYNTVRYERPQCMLIVAGSHPPAMLPLRADLITRLSWGLTYEVRALTEVQKSAAMAAYAGARGLVVAPEVFGWLLQTLPRDMRTLLAALDALDHYSLAAKRTVTLPLAREWLRSLA
jgi:DnaA-homolog protein